MALSSTTTRVPGGSGNAGPRNIEAPVPVESKAAVTATLRTSELFIAT